MAGGECPQMKQHGCNGEGGWEHPAHARRYTGMRCFGALAIVLPLNADVKILATAPDAERRYEKTWLPREQQQALLVCQLDAQ
jgi:hypothetical protein